MRHFVFMFILVLTGFYSYGNHPDLAQDSVRLPKVFLLGEYEVQMDQQSLVHSTNLLKACDDDIELAYAKWISMVKEIEAYAKKIEFDINGVKVWLNVFYSSNGKIAHIGYHLKPNSRNISKAEFAAFLRSFVNNYTFPHTYDKPFSHYGSAGFPTFAFEGSRPDTSSAGKGQQ
ncbi:MAG: hypothetical protein KJP00_07580 [Bacteroidia bacterium]|nr:hypothetical protein [Bacteroidia bacterium]